MLWQKYWPHNSQTWLEHHIWRQGVGACPAITSPALGSKASSASLTVGCSSGWLRNQARKAVTQAPPTKEKRTRVQRHVSFCIATNAMADASAPPHRALIQSKPCDHDNS